jgi:hypothetical protein
MTSVLKKLVFEVPHVTPWGNIRVPKDLNQIITPWGRNRASKNTPWCYMRGFTAINFSKLFSLEIN